MDFLLFLLNLIAYWRVGICLAISIAMAASAHALFPQLPDGGLVLIAATGTGLGVFWQGRVEAGAGGTERATPIVLSRPVECLSLWFFGAIYGGLLAAVLGSPILAAIAIVLSVVGVAGWHSHGSQRRTVGYYAYAATSMVAGFGSLMLLGHYGGSSF